MKKDRIIVIMLIIFSIMLILWCLHDLILGISRILNIILILGNLIAIWANSLTLTSINRFLKVYKDYNK